MWDFLKIPAFIIMWKSAQKRLNISNISVNYMNETVIAIMP